MGPLFEGASAGMLRHLAEAFRSRRLAVPASAFAISKAVPCPAPVVEQLIRLGEEGIAAPHLALLLEAAAECVEVRGSHVRAELVWSGPEVGVAPSRDTAVVLQELFSQAREEVLVSTFVVYEAGHILRALADAMAMLLGLRVRIFLHIGRSGRDTTTDDVLVRQFAERLRDEWGAGRYPEIYYDPRGLSPDSTVRATWHAKCAVVDRQLAFVTSANFTQRAQTRNVEAGVLIRSAQFAGQLAEQLDALLHHRLIRRLPGF